MNNNIKIINNGGASFVLFLNNTVIINNINDEIMKMISEFKLEETKIEEHSIEEILERR